MPGHIKKREYTDEDGNVVRTVWRARMPDPDKPASTGAQREKSFARKKDAEDWLDKAKAAVKQGTYIDPRKGDVTVADVADRWRATWDAKPLQPKTQRGYTSTLNNHILPRFGGTRVAAVDAADIQDWLNDLNQTLHAETVHGAYSTLRQVMKTAVRHRLITTSPCSAESVTLPSKRAARATATPQLYLDAAEVRQLHDAMPAHWQLPVLVAAYCGVRAGELWALRRCDVDLLHRQLHVAHALKDVWGELFVGGTKTHAQRSMSVPKSLLPTLEAALNAPAPKLRRIRPDGQRGGAHGYAAIKRDAAGMLQLGWTDDAADTDRLLFTMPTGHPVRHLNFLRRVWRPTINELWPAGHRLHRLRFHDLRHTCASLSLAATGGNLHVVKERLGHSSITVTVDRYGRLQRGMDDACADGLDAMITGAADTSAVATLHR